jgi:predicted ATPase
MTTVEQALAWARRLSHPYSLVFAEYGFSNIIEILAQRNAHVVQERAENGIALCTEYGLPDFAAFFTVYRGWAIAQQGREQEGVTQIRGALETLQVRGAELDRPKHLCLLAEACRALGRLDDGLAALSDALVQVKDQENRINEAEVQRLKGELLQQSGRDVTEALRCFHSAIEVARRQGARSYELRATTSFARLLASQGRRGEAQSMLAEIYGWFTEGFDTADLREARQLLEELGA